MTALIDAGLPGEIGRMPRLQGRVNQLINIENLSKTFNLHILNNKEICAFNDISFEVRKGEFLGLSGPSGAGKSSILKCIYRTYLPTGGAHMV